MGEAKRRLTTGTVAAMTALGAGGAPPAGGAAIAVPVKIRAQVPGVTTLVLEDGTVLAGQLTVSDIKKRLGVKDDNGNDVYDVQWNVQTGIVKAAE